MFRMTVEDVFVIRNRGVVATGRVESGSLRVGDTVQIDGSLEATVDAIEVFRKSIDQANTGDNIGVLFKKLEKSQLDRGSVLSSSSSSYGSYGEAPPI
jgi:translation elongation factor EF-Tu-like GTPase